MTDSLAKVYSWSGQRKTLKFSSTVVCQLIISELLENQNIIQNLLHMIHAYENMKTGTLLVMKYVIFNLLFSIFTSSIIVLVIVVYLIHILMYI